MVSKKAREERQNHRKARLMYSAMEVFYYATGNELQGGIVDVLTDVRHLCDSRDIDFDAAVKASRKHFESDQANAG